MKIEDSGGSMIDYTQGTGKQYHIGLAKGDVGRYVILTGDPKRCKKIASHFDNPIKVADNREYTTYTGYVEGYKMSVTSTGIGGPSASIALEELVNIGADTFIRVGTCGGIDLDVIGGDIVIANSSIRMEGTTREYVSIEFPAVANIDITNALIYTSKSLGYRYHVGTVQSKDSFYGEHQPELHPAEDKLKSKWKEWIRMGTLASEMETASLFIVGAYRKVRVGACLLCLANQERELHNMTNKQFHDTDLIINLAVKSMLKIAEDDNKK